MFYSEKQCSEVPSIRPVLKFCKNSTNRPDHMHYLQFGSDICWISVQTFRSHLRGNENLERLQKTLLVLHFCELMDIGH